MKRRTTWSACRRSQKKLGEADFTGWMTAEQGKAIKEVGGGGRLSVGVSQQQPDLALMNKDYRDVEGATTPATSHPVRTKLTSSIATIPSPGGVNDFVVTDEQHYVTYDKDPKNVLARSINAKAAWIIRIRPAAAATRRKRCGPTITARAGVLHGAGAHDRGAVEPGIRKMQEECGKMAAA